MTQSAPKDWWTQAGGRPGRWRLSHEMPELASKDHFTLWGIIENLETEAYLEFASGPWSSHTRMKAEKLLAEVRATP